MSRRPDDPRRFRPSPGWFGVAAVVLMAGIFVFIGTVVWAAAHHRGLVRDLTGSWTQKGTGGDARLLIWEETKTVQVTADEQRTSATGALLVTGTIAGRKVSGRIVIHSFPPWGSTVRMTLLGEGWTLSVPDSSYLSATSDSGRLIEFSPAY